MHYSKHDSSVQPNFQDAMMFHKKPYFVWQTDEERKLSVIWNQNCST